MKKATTARMSSQACSTRKEDQEGEDLTRGFEDEAHDRAYQPGQEGAQLLANSLEPLALTPTQHEPPLQASSSSIPRIRIWSIVIPNKLRSNCSVKLALIQPQNILRELPCSCLLLCNTVSLEFHLSMIMGRLFVV